VDFKITPVLMGSAYKNKAVQKLLDAVVAYLPDPTEVVNQAVDVARDEERIVLDTDLAKPAVALAFKLEDGRYGQLTYLRVYQGKLARDAFITNTRIGKEHKVGRLVRMHSERGGHRGGRRRATSSPLGIVCKPATPSPTHGEGEHDYARADRSSVCRSKTVATRARHLAKACALPTARTHLRAGVDEESGRSIIGRGRAAPRGLLER
jgi:hypothetical protein